MADLPGGVLTWESGPNAGLFRIHPGREKRLDTCIDRLADVLDFRGKPDASGPDSLMN